MGKIEIILGNICQQKTDAIVNAANTELLHGGGVAAAIVEAGGDEIQKESNAIAPIALGEAAVTTAGKLKSKYVIHAASMALGGQTEEEYLRQSVRNSFLRVRELNLKSVSFPAIGTGIGGFPIQKCATICLTMAKQFLASDPEIEKIAFVLYNEKDFNIFQNQFNILNDSRQ